MKITIGIVLGLIISFGAVAFAKEVSVTKDVGMVEVNSIGVGGFYTLHKVYDYDNNKVCYVMTGNGTGISCINN